MRKINLEEILRKHTSVEWECVSPKELILKAMLDFGQQLLKLAAENAIYQINPDDKGLIKVANESILNTIKQVE